MKKTYDVVALGEILIDFTPAGSSENHMQLFEQNPGGAPVNMLTAVTKNGYQTAFLGKVGDDMHGRFLLDTAKDLGIDVSGLIVANDVFTTLAFVTLQENGERTFSFARKPGADTQICYRELKQELLKNTKIFHVGSGTVKFRAFFVFCSMMDKRYLSPSFTMSASLRWTMSEIRKPKFASRVNAVAIRSFGLHPVKPCFMVWIMA